MIIIAAQNTARRPHAASWSKRRPPASLMTCAAAHRRARLFFAHCSLQWRAVASSGAVCERKKETTATRASLARAATQVAWRMRARARVKSALLPLLLLLQNCRSKQHTMKSLELTRESELGIRFGCRCCRRCCCCFASAAIVAHQWQGARVRN